MTDEKKIALVTGANKGLGFETSRELASRGIKVIMGARKKAKGDDAASRLSREGLDVECIELDITNSEQINAAKIYIGKTFGRLDILVNNAGIASAGEKMFSNTSEVVKKDTLKEVFNTNFFGTVELTQALLPLLKKSKSGRIVNVSSILGSLTLHTGHDFDQIKPLAYDASKSALNQFTIHLAAALKGSSVKVNSAHPGWVKTDLGGDQAPLTVEEGAKTIIALAAAGDDSPSGKFIHMGEELPW